MESYHAKHVRIREQRIGASNAFGGGVCDLVGAVEKRLPHEQIAQFLPDLQLPYEHVFIHPHVASRYGDHISRPGMMREHEPRRRLLFQERAGSQGL